MQFNSMQLYEIRKLADNAYVFITHPWPTAKGNLRIHWIGSKEKVGPCGVGKVEGMR